MSEFLRIDNHGPLITSTNYWDLPHKPGENLLVSCNAGAFRILLLPHAENFLKDMQTAHDCAVSRGPWPAAGLADAFEILFDDGSRDPFALHLSGSSFFLVPAVESMGQEWLLTVWLQPRRGHPHKALERRCFYRSSSSLPDLRPAKEA